MLREEVEQEVEAMEAVYGSECTLFQTFPPHLNIFMTPRTADDASVQFVEAFLVIKAGEQYPDVPPDLELKDVKGLGDSREAKLLGDLRAQAAELSGGPMLVAICEAATDLLTNMNSPEGDCCFCMDPLDDGAKPFMKLMTCFHCFHRWLQQHEQSRRPPVHPARLQDDDGDERSIQLIGSSEDRNNTRAAEELPMHCPVCRKVILAEDVAHVRDYLTKDNGTKPFFLQCNEDTRVPMSILTDAELVRRAQYTAQFEAQLERGGIIELKKLEVIQPGMLVFPRTPSLQETFSEEHQQQEDQGPADISRRGIRTLHAHPNGARDGFRGGISYRGSSGGRSYRGRHAEGIRANRAYRGRSATWRDTGMTEAFRMQSQDTRQLERGIVETTRIQSQFTRQSERPVVETLRMQALDTRQQGSSGVSQQTSRRN